MVISEITHSLLQTHRRNSSRVASQPVVNHGFDLGSMWLKTHFSTHSSSPLTLNCLVAPAKLNWLESCKWGWVFKFKLKKMGLSGDIKDSQTQLEMRIKIIYNLMLRGIGKKMEKGMTEDEWAEGITIVLLTWT